jgi:hypothetical protein
MLELLQYIINALVTDSTLTAIVPAKQIFTGPVDVATEKQAELLLPQINVHIISEATRTVPLNARDTMVQIDIWSRNSVLETINIYEEILNALNYVIADKSTSHIFWQRSGAAVDQYESDRRIFHRSMTIQAWVMHGQ